MSKVKHPLQIWYNIYFDCVMVIQCNRIDMEIKGGKGDCIYSSRIYQRFVIKCRPLALNHTPRKNKGKANNEKEDKHLLFIHKN